MFNRNAQINKCIFVKISDRAKNYCLASCAGRQLQPAVPLPEEQGGCVYKPLGDCPARYTVSELLEWAVHTAADHRDQGHEAPVRDQGHPAAVQDRGVVCGE